MKKNINQKGYKGKLQNNVRKVRSIPLKYDKQIVSLGHGNFKHGIKRVSEICQRLNEDGEKASDIKKRILMQDCNKLMEDLKDFFPRNHYIHFGHFPIFFSKFLDTGELDFIVFKGKGKKE